MADLRELVNETENSKQSWVENKKAEREEVSVMQDEGIISITENPQAYLRYLNLQADNPHLSVGNIALIMQQKPDSTKVASLEKWNKLGRSVNTGEVGTKIMMPDKYIDKEGNAKTGYKIGRVFDLSQTSGKAIPPSIKLKNGTPDMQKAIKTLIELCPVPIKVVDEGVPTAVYMEANKQVYISASLPESQTFEVLANEIIHAKIHNGGAYEGYNREDCELDADSVSYMLCRRFGIEADEPDANEVEYYYSDLETADCRSALDGIQKMSAEMGDKVEYAVAPPEQGKEPKTQEQSK